MVLEIPLANFFSINEKATLDMQVANIQTKEACALEDNTFSVGNERLLKTVAIYGANGSGKSNIIKAIKSVVDMVELSFKDGELTTFHRCNPSLPFDYNTEESEGTKILFKTMLTVMDVVRNNKVMFLDEVETSLHTRLVEYLISLFHSSKSAKLVFTTHNAHLPDMTRFRKFDLDVPGVLEHLRKIKDALLLLSKPRIEFWFVLHYRDTNRELSSSECLALLRSIDTDYVKGTFTPTMKKALIDLVEDATKRANPKMRTVIHHLQFTC